VSADAEALDAGGYPVRYQHEHRYVDPASAVPARGDRLQVINWRDPRANQVGRVRRVRLEAGELLVRLGFEDGGTCDFWESELMAYPRRGPQ